jgi:hypothetical protein
MKKLLQKNAHMMKKKEESSFKEIHNNIPKNKTTA